jgi:phosphohistidine phosphatase
MPQLWLLRHAEAEAHGSRPDAERKLTVKGRTQARRAGRALARLGVGFAGVYTSPRVRALDTARLACKPLDIEPIVHMPLDSGFDHSDAAELLAGAGADDRLLLVGHEPDFSQLVRDLSGARVDIKKGGIAALRVESGGAELIALLRPREIELVAVRR